MTLSSESFEKIAEGLREALEISGRSDALAAQDGQCVGAIPTREKPRPAAERIESDSMRSWPPHRASLIERAIARLSRRAPDFQIGGAENPYCNRWWVIPRNRWFNVYLHQFLRDDDDRALHTHPWLNCSIPLLAGYVEVLFDHAPTWAPLPPLRRRIRRPGSVTFRKAATPHRVELHRDAAGQPLPAWSLFLTGPVIREWGFRCPKGFVHWRDFTAGPNGETVGKGCEQ